MASRDVRNQLGVNSMLKTFRVRDHVQWNSEAGNVSGMITRKISSDIKIKGYMHHASREAPQYLIKSDKTDHVAVHKGTALRSLPARKKIVNKKKTVVSDLVRTAKAGGDLVDLTRSSTPSSRGLTQSPSRQSPSTAQPTPEIL